MQILEEVTVVLMRSSDDQPLLSAEYQEELQKVRSSLRGQGIEASAPFIVMDSPMGGGGYIGEFIIPLAQAIGPTLGVILVAWLQGRSGRKVRVKIGDVEAEGRTFEEVEGLLQKAKKFQDEKSSDGEGRSP
jgi:hypothetical protein